jgi:hypothetical protein
MKKAKVVCNGDPSWAQSAKGGIRFRECKHQYTISIFQMGYIHIDGSKIGCGVL